MTYVMSDIHGRYELYRAMLDKIGFGHGDTLYLLGDLVDRGEGGVRVLLDVMARPNVIALTGNHDKTMATLLRNEKSLLSRLGKERLIALFRLWFSDGGKPTFTAIRALDAPTREKVLVYADEMSYYAEVVTGGKRYFLAHTVPGFEPDVPLTDRPADDFIHGTPDYDKRYLPDTEIVTGHTPTALIDPAYAGRILRKNGHIALDCGAGSGGPLGCLCLETGREYYVKPEDTRNSV